jgi:hypothetical protein
MRNKMAILVVLLSMAVVTLACGLSLNDGKLSIPITLNKDTLIRIISSAQSVASSGSDGNVLVEVQDLDFIEPDKIKAYGRYTSLSGVQVNGEVELTFSVVNDEPKVEITWVNIPGLDLASDTVKKANETLSQVMREQVRQADQEAVIKSIAVEGDALKIMVEVPIRR